jgi:predicted PhzF superfamily epimerase YddE/YHI9
VPSVAVDFAGNAAVGRAVHTRLADTLAYSCTVGVTHVGARNGSGEPLPGPAPILFFAPDHATATVKELSPQGFAKAVGERWRDFVASTDGFMTVNHRDGVQAAADAFAETLKGVAPPDVGIVVRP